MALYDMTDWPVELREALEPGNAPGLDALAEKVRRRFYARYSEADDNLLAMEQTSVNNLAYKASCELDSDSRGKVLLEIYNLSTLAWPFVSVLGELVSEAETPDEVMDTLISLAVAARVLLDPEIDRLNHELVQAINELKQEPQAAEPIYPQFIAAYWA